MSANCAMCGKPVTSQMDEICDVCKQDPEQVLFFLRDKARLGPGSGEEMSGLTNIELTGQGGMGQVWRVHHEGWNTDLAVKQPKAEYFQNEQQKEAFLRECEKGIDLGLHPHIVSCYYVRRLRGIPAIFSEYMDGGSLEAWIYDGKLYADGEQSAAGRILDIAIQFARGLRYIHDRRDENGQTLGLIHQDVKPGNLLLTLGGEAKVADFGLSRAHSSLMLQGVDIPENGTIVSASGSLTLAYCSPEQLRGESLTRRTDIYSWAVSVLEMFLGGLKWKSGPEAGTDSERYLAMEMRVPMPDNMKALLRQCLSASPKQRPRDFSGIDGQLQRIYESVTGSAYPRESSDAAADTADSLNNRALSFLEMGKAGEAETCWERALATTFGHVRSLYNRAIFHWREAKIDFSQCQAILVNNYAMTKSDDCAYMLAHFYIEGGQPQQAADYISRIRHREEYPDVGQMQSRVEKLASLRLVLSKRPIHGVLPSGRFFYSYKYDGWETEDTSVFDSKTLEHQYDFRKVPLAFSPDEHYALVFRRGECVLEMIELETDTSLLVIEAEDRIKTAAFSKDMKRIKVLAEDGIIRIYDIQTGSCLMKSEKIREKMNYGVQFLSPHLDCAVYQESFGSCTLMNLADLSKIEIGGYIFMDDKPGFSQDDSLLLMPDHNQLLLYETKTGRCLKTIHHDANDIVFCRDNQYAVTVKKTDDSKKYVISLLDVLKGRVLSSLESEYQPSFFYDTDSEACVVCYIQGYSFLDRDPLREDKLQILCLPFSAPRAPFLLSRITNTGRQMQLETQSRLLLECIREALEVLDVGEALRLIGSREDLGIDDSPAYMHLNDEAGKYCQISGVSSVLRVSRFDNHKRWFSCFRPHTDTFFSANGMSDWTGPTAECRNMRTGELVKEYEDPDLDSYLSQSMRLFFDKRGKHMLSSKAHGFIQHRKYALRLWDIDAGIPLGAVETDNFRCALSSSGCFFLNLKEYDTVELRDAKSMEVLSRYTNDHGKKNVFSFVLDTQENTLYLSGEGTLSIWSIGKNTCKVVNFEGMKEFFLSPDEKYGVYFTKGKMHVLDMQTLQTINIFTFDGDEICAACFSPDGMHILTGFQNNTVKLFHLLSGNAIAEIKTTASVYNVDFHTSGKFILISTTEGASVYRLCYTYAFPGWKDWDEGATPYVRSFLASHPDDADKQFDALITELQTRGFGHIRPKSVQAKLDEFRSVRKAEFFRLRRGGI